MDKDKILRELDRYERKVIKMLQSLPMTVADRQKAYDNFQVSLKRINKNL